MFSEFLGVDVSSGGAGGNDDPSAGDNEGTPADPSAGGDDGAPADLPAGDDVGVLPAAVAWDDVAADYTPPAPEGVSADDWTATVSEFAQAAHEAGIDKDVFGKLVAVHLERDARVAAEQEAVVQQGIAQLESEWGAEYKIKVQAAVGTLEKYARKAGVDFGEIDNNPAFTMNPPLMRILAAMAGDVGGGKHVSIPGAAATKGGSEEADRIMTDPSHPMHEAFMNSNHIGYKAANARVNVLLGIK